MIQMNACMYNTLPTHRTIHTDEKQRERENVNFLCFQFQLKMKCYGLAQRKPHTASDNNNRENMKNAYLLCECDVRMGRGENDVENGFPLFEYRGDIHFNQSIECTCDDLHTIISVLLKY